MVRSPSRMLSAGWVFVSLGNQMGAIRRSLSRAHGRLRGGLARRTRGPVAWLGAVPLRLGRTLAVMTDRTRKRIESDCVFCGIVRGALPSTTIAETERTVAFMDINPVTAGHALVVPRSHATDLLDVESEDLAACVELAREVARRAKDRLGADGINLLNCTGEAAWQSVFHFHIHVIPRYADDPGKDAIGLPWRTLATTPDETARIGELLS